MLGNRFRREIEEEDRELEAPGSGRFATGVDQKISIWLSGQKRSRIFPRM